MEELLVHPMLAKALITWTVETYYIVVAILHFIAVLVGFKLTNADSENNPIISALVVAVVTAAAGYFVRDNGLVGLMITGSVIFGSLLLVSAGDAIRSLVLTGVCIVVYAGVGYVVVPRTPLTAEQVGGFVNAFMNGVNEEPLGNEDDLYEHTKKKADESTGTP